MVQFACFASTIEPKDHTEALSDEFWIQAMQEELNQFVKNDVWEYVEKTSRWSHSRNQVDLQNQEWREWNCGQKQS